MQKVIKTASVDTQGGEELWDDFTYSWIPAEEYDAQDAEDRAVELVEEWLTAQNLSQFEQVLIRGLRLGWLQRDGWKLAGTEPLEILRSLYLNSEFRIELTLEGGDLIAHRYSHDEPTGATLYFERVLICGSAECEVSEGLITDTEGVPRCDWHADN
jgi:hypothetical protein